MARLRARKRNHVDISIEDDGREVKSKYFKSETIVKESDDGTESVSAEDTVDIEWIKSLNSEEYFEWVSKVTDDRPERWNKPLDPDIFLNRPEGAPPLPENFIPIYTRVRLMRSKIRTPVDSVGCAAIPITVNSQFNISQNQIKPKNYRLQLLVALMLSAQTKDELNAEAMSNLIRYSIDELDIPEGLTLEALLRIDEKVLVDLVKMVGFHNRKAHYVKQTAEILAKQFDSDIPADLVGILSLPGVGPKMGLLALQKAWGKMSGIGVDVHVHRLCKMWGWVDAKKCKTADHTRRELESWLPKALWYEINPLLVGFGQVICMSRGKRCDICLANDVCNAVDKKLLKTKDAKKGSHKMPLKSNRGDFSLWLEYLAEKDSSFKIIDEKEVVQPMDEGFAFIKKDPDEV
ncbi:hypothetical protein HG536_0F03770 [Torulaspora globosa]|uniref:Endonuclease III homolog n=1 Tax=Torulaspora globosa TaxID=48254 RepID=A0A7G3ZKL6_9SACH|nr:uncharacterized protein HG536_0F03770 [Torulaspora globosa]QLL34052.1 hypothetical protein HG536_0F03770 [Torulaspora globosa]